MISHGVDYIFILSRAVAVRPSLDLETTRVGVLPCSCEQSLPFRVSRYGVIQKRILETSHGIAAWRLVRSRATGHGRVHRYKPICWYRITPAAPQCVKVPNLLA